MSNGTPIDKNDLLTVLSNTTSAQEFFDKNGFNIKYQNITKARIKGVKISDFSISDSYISNFDARNSTWKNGTFKNTELDQMYFDNSSFENVNFENCKITDANFIESQLTNVKFINCEISRSALNYLINSDVEFIKSRLINNEDNFSDSQIKLRLIDSVIKNTNFEYLKKGSSVYLENSENINSHYTQSELNFFKIINSKIIDTSAADAEIEEMDIYKSKLKLSFSEAKINSISIETSDIVNFGAMEITSKNVSIRNCTGNGKLSFYKANIETANISNCNFSIFYPIYTSSETFVLENSSISDADFTEANINNFSMKNVTFVEKAEFTDFKPSNATLENIKKCDSLQLITDGSTIKF